MKYFVIAKKWDAAKKAMIEYIAGEFDNYFLATIFKEAYDAHFVVHSHIIDSYDLLNNFVDLEVK